MTAEQGQPEDRCKEMMSGHQASPFAMEPGGFEDHDDCLLHRCAGMQARAALWVKGVEAYCPYVPRRASEMSLDEKSPYLSGREASHLTRNSEKESKVCSL